MQSPLELPSDRRCKRYAGPNWRCSEEAAPGKYFCEKHWVQRRNHIQKRKAPKNKGEREVGVSGGSRKHEFRSKRRRLSSEPGGEESESDLPQKPVKNQNVKLSACKKKKVVEGNGPVVDKVSTRGEDCDSTDKWGMNDSTPMKPSVHPVSAMSGSLSPTSRETKKKVLLIYNYVLECNQYLEKWLCCYVNYLMELSTEQNNLMENVFLVD